VQGIILQKGHLFVGGLRVGASIEVLSLNKAQKFEPSWVHVDDKADLDFGIRYVKNFVCEMFYVNLSLNLLISNLC
jgi:hypothetical protein